MEIRGKGKPIFCGSDGEWKEKLEKCLQADDRIVLLALGDVKYEVLSYLNKRKDIEIVKLETRYMKKREKGTGVKVTVRRRMQAEPLQK
jgi:hypothetical protein